MRTLIARGAGRKSWNARFLKAVKRSEVQGGGLRPLIPVPRTGFPHSGTSLLLQLRRERDQTAVHSPAHSEPCQLKTSDLHPAGSHHRLLWEVMLHCAAPELARPIQRCGRRHAERNKVIDVR